MVRIITGETPTEELSRRFKEELVGMMKDAALKLKCNVEELKYRINNAGIVEIERMSTEEMLELTAQEEIDKRVVKIKKDRGVFYE